MTTQQFEPATHSHRAADLELKITQTGDQLLATLSGVLDALHTASGPQALATKLGVDKVLSSRVLKAIQNRDPMAAMHRVPGPEPLRRLLRASAKQGVSQDLIARANAAVDRFEALIRDDIGDRSALEAILSSWIPEARREFETRRKQAAFRALSQLKGVQAGVNVGTVFLAPATPDDKIDVVWVNGLLGLQRLRPGAVIRFASRRFARDDSRRLSNDLSGRPVEDLEHLQLAEFCSDPLPAIDVHRAGQTIHYTLADHGFGPRSESDIIFAEANLSELPRYVEPAVAGTRRAYVFAEVFTPSKVLQFDVLVHRDLYPDQHPELLIYDAAIEGIADVNDPARDLDRMDMMESIEPLGRGVAACRSADVPRYPDMLRHVCDRLTWDPNEFRVYRCRIDYPLYGSQVVMTFRTVARP